VQSSNGGETTFVGNEVVEDWEGGREGGREGGDVPAGVSLSMSSLSSIERIHSCSFLRTHI